MNMDYALCETIKHGNTEDSLGVVLAYDINCQYSINLEKRIAVGPFLDWPSDLLLLPAIGLFHVHGHQEQCYARYAPTFVHGIGKADREILETNWGVLNRINPMTWTMTLAHRTEVMDAHIADNNWKKMVNMGEVTGNPHHSTVDNTSEAVLCNKWKKICKSGLEHTEDFELMNETASTEQIKTWTELAEDADRDRLTDVSIMETSQRSYTRHITTFVTL